MKNLPPSSLLPFSSVPFWQIKTLKTLDNSRKEKQRGGRQESHSNLKRKSSKSLKSLEVCVFWRALVPRHRYSKLSATFSKTASNELPDSRSDMMLWCTSHIMKFHRKGFDTTVATGTTGLGTRARDQGPGCQQGVSTRLYEALKIKDWLLTTYLRRRTSVFSFTGATTNRLARE